MPLQVRALDGYWHQRRDVSDGNGRRPSRGPPSTDALDFLADTITYGLSLAVIGASQRARASAALLKGASLSLMAIWVTPSSSACQAPN
jgi:hypothetical protein